MREIEMYVEKITLGLPLSNNEKEDIKEEIISHLEEHINELLSYGWEEEKAIDLAIQSFGDANKIHKEMKKAIFPFYKIVRALFGALFMTIGMCYISYAGMEFYNPQFDNIQSLEYYLMVFLLFTFFVAVGELLFEGIIQESRLNWLANPWVFCLIPLIIATFVSLHNWTQRPEHYHNGLWLDLFSVHIGIFLYLLSRELFTYLLVPRVVKHMNL
ncbi:permease prefix domain 1-containing protein [Mesobacillus maritimus]|uniref:DUF1129 domain-containing protein n=1 Tax=Mesobacillus maritimus TaxID=1643336 RepID=A0ABS7JZX4_9BACI|nr:permease prefix domain 1-containing protein [Mesobacillus maritimus]MBY0095542.1 hypothetical protein [Mesobacillus maritimus]